MKNGAVAVPPLISERLMIVHLEAVRYQYLQALHTANRPFCVRIAGVVEAGVGMAVGGVLGILMFTSKSGWRSASVAAGFGVAAGSTFERIRKSYN